MFDEKLTHAAWKSKPSWHVISINDRTLSPAMEEDDAKRSGELGAHSKSRSMHCREQSNEATEANQ
jgi:hypothetical protein